MSAHATSDGSTTGDGAGRRRGASSGAHASIVLTSRIAAAAMSAMVGLVVPRALGVAESANYGIVVGIALMFVVLSDMGLTTSLARSLAEGRVDRALCRRVAALRFGVALGAAGLFGALAIAVSRGADLPLLDERGVDPGLLAAGGVLVLAASISGVAAGLLPTLRRVQALFVVTVIQPMLEFGGVVLAALVGAGATGVVLASTLAALVAGTIGIAAVLRGIRAGTPSHADGVVTVHDVRAYGWPMFLVAISFTLFGQVDQLIIYVTRSAEEAAAYIWQWRLITLLHMPGLAIATVVAPRLAGRSGAAAQSFFAGWLRVLVVAYLGMVAIAAALAPWLVPVAIGQRYADDWPIFAGLSVYAFLLGIAPLVTMSANFLGGARSRVRLGFVTIGLNIIIDLALIPRIGVAGAIIGTTVAFSWYVAAHARLSWRLLSTEAAMEQHSAARRASTQAPSSTPLLVAAAASAALFASLANIAAHAIDDTLLGDVGALLISGTLAAVAYGGLVLGAARLLDVDLLAPARHADVADVMPLVPAAEGETIDHDLPVSAAPRILHVADFSAPYPGAFIRQLTMLDEELRRRSARPMAFAFPERARGCGWITTLEDAGCIVRFLPEPATRMQRHVRDALVDLVVELDATTVHTHFGSYDMSATAAVRELRAVARPELGLVWHYRTALETTVEARSITRRLKDHLKFARAGRHADRCIAVTQALADEVAARGMGSRACAVVAGCDTEHFRAADDVARAQTRAALGVDDDTVLLLHLGWHWHRKGGDLLADAMRQLDDDPSLGPVVAMSIGAPTDELEAPVRALDPTDAIHELHQAADIFISASRSEGFGNGLVEAMACERVAVAAMVDGQREVFDELGGVVAVTPGDATALAYGIRELLARRASWAADGATNRERILDRHSMRRWARELADEYARLGLLPQAASIAAQDAAPDLEHGSDDQQAVGA